MSLRIFFVCKRERDGLKMTNMILVKGLKSYRQIKVFFKKKTTTQKLLF